MNLTHRPRRLRRTPLLREMMAETETHPRRLVTPHFVVPGEGVDEEIASMPGVRHVSVDRLVEEVRSDVSLGLKSHLLFGVPESRDEAASAAVDPDDLVPRAVRALKDAFAEETVVITDVCLCAYTTHGHCGLLAEDGTVDNDSSVERLAGMARVHADAGADLVSPSDMMDGRVGRIREVLDHAGHTDTGILAYSAKFASAYYGPFRDACDSAPAGDRKTYQMDCRNAREALTETMLDIEEGADIVMVKPALAYLDVVAAVRAESLKPVAVYNVSGEYSMVKAAAAAGLVEEAALVRENLLAMRRAGADLIVTYHGREAIREGWL